MKSIQYKGYDIFLNKVDHNGSFLATWSNQYGENRGKTLFYGYSLNRMKKEVFGLIDDSLDKPITYHRNPTPSEIRFGHGATHYKDFILADVIKQCGNVKQWIVCPHDGLRYYR